MLESPQTRFPRHSAPKKQSTMSLLEDHLETGRSRRQEVDSAGSPGWKKFLHYNVEVDPAQDDKAKEILLCSFTRPHMR